jgi:hypothetical protein
MWQRGCASFHDYSSTAFTRWAIFCGFISSLRQDICQVPLFLAEPYYIVLLRYATYTHPLEFISYPECKKLLHFYIIMIVIVMSKFILKEE